MGVQYVWVGEGAAVDVQVSDPVVLLYARDEVAVGVPHGYGYLGRLLGDVIGDVRPGFPGAHHKNPQTGILVRAGVCGGMQDLPFEALLPGKDWQ